MFSSILVGLGLAFIVVVAVASGLAIVDGDSSTWPKDEESEDFPEGL